MILTLQKTHYHPNFASTEMMEKHFICSNRKYPLLLSGMGRNVNILADSGFRNMVTKQVLDKSTNDKPTTKNTGI
jgi:hypothetical protein